MSDLWDRQEGEPLRWYQRFEKYRLMEPLHSIPKVFQEEQTLKNPEKPRMKPDKDWYAIAKQWRWEERAAAWDASQDDLLEKQIAAEEKNVLREAFALKHRRVKELNRIVEKLIAYVEDEEHIWLPDVKAIGTGPNARQVDLIRFNAALFSEIRAHFDDIAKEKGERVKKSDVSIKELPANVYIGIQPDEDGVDR